MTSPASPSVLASLTSPACWDDNDQATLRCVGVLEITRDIKSFVFEPREDSLFDFEAGQFLTLLLTIEGHEVSRCYTISSPPTRPHRISITVKRVLDGLVSNWLHENLRTGDLITAAAPGGAFTIANPAEKFLYLSAGSGITPLMSMSRTLHDAHPTADVTFVHSARTPDDILFRTELTAMETVMPNLSVTHICEADYPSEPWTGPRGRLSTDLLTELVPDLSERVVYTCGPAPYMESVRNLLGELGFDMSRYHEESFTFDLAEPPAEIAEAAIIDEAADSPLETEENDGFTIEFAKTGRTITCRSDEFVLNAALREGVRMASTCTQGMCGTCKVTLLDGEVDMNHNGGIRPKEIANGKILACCSKPLGDLRIDH